MENRDKIIIYGKLAISACCWGGSFVAAKIVVTQLPPTLAAAIRFTLAFALLLIILIAKEGRNAWVHPKDWLLFLGAAITGIAFYNIFFFTGMQYTSSVNGSLIVATGPVVTALLSAPLLKERIHSKHLLGLFLSLIGVGIIVSRGSWGVLKELAINPGDVFIAGAVLCWAFYTIIGKPIAPRWGSLLSTTYACGLGAVILWLGALPQINEFQWSGLEPQLILALFFLAFFASALAFVFWYEGVSHVGASRAAVFQNLVPMFSAIFANIILGEQFFFFHGLGGVLILFGVYLANRPGKKVLTLASVGKD